jgi:predicted DNA-binding transcriptional regulator YafY
MNADLVRAIREKRLVEFDYNTRRRIVEPHDYGVRGGTETLLAYQLSGGSESGAAHGWKEFKVPKIGRLRVLDRQFPGTRGDSAQQHRTWETLFARVS